MNLIDANLLLYAYDHASVRHAKAKQWLERTLSGPEPVGFAWLAIMAFLRIGTSLRILEHPLSEAEATTAVTRWLSSPVVRVFHPGERHWGILRDLIAEGQARGPLVMDAHLAALAIEHGLVVCTADRDFARFPGLRFMNPLN